MATSRPLTTIDRKKRGRPPSVEKLAIREMAQVIADSLLMSGMVSGLVPVSSIKRHSKEIAGMCVRTLNDRDLFLMPGQIVRELALIVGEAAPQPKKENDAKVES